MEPTGTSGHQASAPGSAPRPLTDYTPAEVEAALAYLDERHPEEACEQHTELQRLDAFFRMPVAWLEAYPDLEPRHRAELVDQVLGEAHR